MDKSKKFKLQDAALPLAVAAAFAASDADCLGSRCMNGESKRPEYTTLNKANTGKKFLLKETEKNRKKILAATFIENEDNDNDKSGSNKENPNGSDIEDPRQAIIRREEDEREPEIRDDISGGDAPEGEIILPTYDEKIKLEGEYPNNEQITPKTNTPTAEMGKFKQFIIALYMLYRSKQIKN